MDSKCRRRPQKNFTAGAAGHENGAGAAKKMSEDIRHEKQLCIDL